MRSYDTRVLCAICCEREGRYVAAMPSGQGVLTCALCPLTEKIESVRIADIGPMLTHLRRVLESVQLSEHVESWQALKTLLGRQP